MHRYFVTGTDTDVGKTRVAAALALALERAGRRPTIVKLVQTGASPNDEGDARHAAALAGVPALELVRYEKPADPWSAALAQRETPPTAQRLAGALAAIDGALVAEGAGGIAAPLGPGEHLGHVAVLAKLEVILAVGLRLGCLNHALLTLDLCRELRLPVAGGVLVERWSPTTEDYRADVARVLHGRLPLLGVLPHAAAEQESVHSAAKLFEPLVNQEP